MMKKIMIILCALLLFLSGCIDEDSYGKCRYFLYFSYKGDGNEEMFLDKTGKVNLYIYNQNGELLQSQVVDGKQLLQNQGVELNLPAGKYRVVAWGNAYDHTEIKGEYSLSSGVVGAPPYFAAAYSDGSDVLTTNDSLYYGSREIKILKTENQIDTVHYSSAHIKMLILLTGMKSMVLPDGSLPVDIQVSHLHPTVSFDFRFSGEHVTCFPQVEPDNNTTDFKASFNVLRFNDANEIVIRLMNKNTGQQIYRVLLNDFMREHNITVDGINEATVGIRIKFNGMNITVSPWEQEDIKPGIRY